MKSKSWTKSEYIQEVVKIKGVSTKIAEDIVERIMREHGYVTDKNGVICTFKIN